MPVSAPEVAFEESMRGFLAMGETDPEAGAAAGRKGASKLVLRAAIGIAEIDRFLADPEHRGGLEGSVTHPALGERRPLSRGVFKLFAPGGETAPQLMVYEGAFEAGGESLYFAGRKELRQRSLLALWPETTTLYSRIHAGEGPQGPVVGAGILHLGVPQLLRMLATFRSSSLVGGALKVGRFGAFFTSQLVSAYLLGRHRDSAVAGVSAGGGDSAGRSE